MHRNKYKEDKSIRSTIAPRYLISNEHIVLSLINAKKHSDSGNIAVIAEGMHENGEIWLRYYEFTKNKQGYSGCVNKKESNNIPADQYYDSLCHFLPYHEYYSKSLELHNSEYKKIAQAMNAEQKAPSEYRKTDVGMIESLHYGSTIEGALGITPLQWVKKISACLDREIFKTLPTSIKTFQTESDYVRLENNLKTSCTVS